MAAGKQKGPNGAQFSKMDILLGRGPEPEYDEAEMPDTGTTGRGTWLTDSLRGMAEREALEAMRTGGMFAAVAPDDPQAPGSGGAVGRAAERNGDDYGGRKPEAGAASAGGQCLPGGDAGAAETTGGKKGGGTEQSGERGVG